VLEEVELLVRGGDGEIGALIILALGLDIAVIGEDAEALLAAEGWIGQHVMPFAARIGEQ
jgi:hypothetical protein